MDHNNGASYDGTGKDNGSLMSLYITSTYTTSGTIAINDGSFAPIPFTVTANQVTIVTIPPAAFLGENCGFANKGLHIVALKPVAIYGHIYALAVSGATLLLPVSTLGQDYFSINYTQQSNVVKNSYSAFIVIATEDNTVVKITPSAQLNDGHSPGRAFTVNLNKGELYQGLSPSDLSGTHITATNSTTGSCTKIAVFSGSSRIDIGCNEQNNSSDNLFQQVYPTASWGKNYITVPLDNRNYDVFRVFLANPAATTNPNLIVNNVPVPLTSFTNGYYEFSSQHPNVISADQPIQVVQYAVTQYQGINCSYVNVDLGDPEMIFLNPLQQTIDHVTLYSTGNYEINRSYINVVMKTASVPTFILDGQPYAAFKPVPNDTLYSYAQIPVQSGPQDVQVSDGSAGTHTISAADGFNAIAYGFGTKESYGYAAGTNLQNLNENIVLASPADHTITQPNGCAGTTYNLQLTLPYQTSNIVWNLKNGATFTDNSPTPIASTTQRGQTLYLYQYPKPVIYNLAGDTSVVATVFNPTSGPCGNNDVVEFDFNISMPPQANFSFDSNQCLGDSTEFTDQTNANNSIIKSWQWDFGDNTTSVRQSPKHRFTAPGDYKVNLTVTNVNGCSSISTQTIHVNRLPVVAFSTSAPYCAGQDVTFTDQSTTADGKIVQWIWNYGDGKTDTLTTNRPVSHIYANTGADTVKLTVLTSTGCSNTSSQALAINPLPVVDFALPAVCLNDTYAQFTDESAIADRTQQAFTYLWNFGDPLASAEDNTSTLQNPKHKYSQASNYNVTLTVTSKYGCAVTKAQSFTVNGDTPVAAFSVENSNNLCSVNDVIFDDQSTVNFGAITKIVWYFDYNNNPADTTVFLPPAMAADRKYRHNYGLFNAPLSKSYTVRMDVYSGVTCINTTQQNITIYANPTASLSPIGPLCADGQPVRIMANNNGFAGTGVFSGTGVSSTGLFTPAVSGIGSFTVNYTLTSPSGCTYTTSEQVVVNADPQVSLASDITMLEGGQITLPATASGDSLTYQWTPSNGLDHDNILNPMASPSNSTTYQLTVTNPQGCSAAAQINVNVLKYPVIPNAFTPNGDGINDTWNIQYLSSYPNNTVNIYNRYGQIVYASVGYSIPWDGTYRGAVLPAGTYYYIIDPKNGRKPISGFVTVIR
jgi:gliding motility-associated-like protein